jgi:hypothetical protein
MTPFWLGTGTSIEMAGLSLMRLSLSSTTKHTYNTKDKTKDRVTRIPLKTGGELRYSGRVKQPLLH